MRLHVPLLSLLVPGLALGQTSLPVSDLTIDGIYATRAGDPVLYCVLGKNACLFREQRDAWTQDELIPRWLKAHPKASAVPVSSRVWSLAAKDHAGREKRVYLWISDGSQSLNAYLVQEGRYPGGLMVDQVEAEEALAKTYDDPKPANYREQDEKARAATPEVLKPHRLVSDATYAEMMRRIGLAEKDAVNSKKGIWAPSGLKGRAPPTDDYLIMQFFAQRTKFDRIKALISQDERLRGVTRNPKTWQNARAEGVDPAAIAEYAALLRKLDVNEELADVMGAGKECLIAADVIYGLFDNGVIKGYVLAPTEPTPMLADLDRRSADNVDETMVYRKVAEDWYLFELTH